MLKSISEIWWHAFSKEIKSLEFPSLTVTNVQMTIIISIHSESVFAMVPESLLLLDRYLHTHFFQEELLHLYNEIMIKISVGH